MLGEISRIKTSVSYDNVIAVYNINSWQFYHLRTNWTIESSGFDQVTWITITHKNLIYIVFVILDVGDFIPAPAGSLRAVPPFTEFYDKVPRYYITFFV